jgi:hypothetical protein
MWRLRRRARGSPPGGAAVLDPPPRVVDDFPGTVDELLEEIDRLSELGRSGQRDDRDDELLRLRHLAGARLVTESRPEPAFAAADYAQLPTATPLAEVRRTELSAALLRAGIIRDGCVLVRDLIDRDDALALAAAVERSFDERDQAVEGFACDDDYYSPFEALEAFVIDDWARATVAQCCGLPLVDAPVPADDLLDLFDVTGISDLVREYLGDRPVISAQKTTLRKVESLERTGWHQDGCCFANEVHALNLWLPLSPCGAEAPGVDVVPLRLDHLLPTGTDDAFMPGQVSDLKASEVTDQAPVVRPTFEPGDALFFDQWLLHRTSFDPAMHRRRLGLECWFFHGSSFPAGYTPIAV